MAQVNKVNFLIDISGSMARKIRWFADETCFQRVIFICQVLINCFPGAEFYYYLINSHEQGKGLIVDDLGEVEQRFYDRIKVANTSDIVSRLNNLLHTTISCSTGKTLLFIFSDGDDTASPEGLTFCHKDKLKELRGKLYTTIVHFGKVIPIPEALYFDGKQKVKKDELRRAVQAFVNEMLLAVEPMVHELEQEQE